jgi:uncharacterized peroxidase-related enzyme
VTRLPSINHAFRLSDRMKLRLIRLASGREPSDILKLLFYRRDFFGDPFTAWVEDVLRGPSEWTVGERELIAAFVSSLNKCRFCTGSHGAVASIDLGPDVTAAVLSDWRTAPIADNLRAALGFAYRLTLTPEAVTAADVLPMREVGLSAEAIGDVVHICGIFATINRIADTVDFGIPDEAGEAASAAVLRKRGYAL